MIGNLVYNLARVVGISVLLYAIVPKDRIKVWRLVITCLMIILVHEGILLTVDDVELKYSLTIIPTFLINYWMVYPLGIKLFNYTILLIELLILSTLLGLIILPLEQVVLMTQELSRYTDILYGLMVGLLTFLLIRYVDLSALYHFVKKRNKIHSVVVLMVYGLTIGIMYLFPNESIYHDIAYHTPSLMIIITILIAFAVIIYMGMQYGKRNLELEKQVLTGHQYNDTFDGFFEELKLSHEKFKAHLEDQRPITRMHEFTSIHSKVMACRNPIIRALLVSKYLSATDQGITLEMDIEESLETSKISDYDLIEIYGILLDNAIEACHHLDNPVISIHLKETYGNQLLKIENPFDVSFQIKDLNNGLVNPRKKKGYGLRKIQRLMKKHLLDLNYDVDEERQRVHARLVHD